MEKLSRDLHSATKEQSDRTSSPSTPLDGSIVMDEFSPLHNKKQPRTSSDQSKRKSIVRGRSPNHARGKNKKGDFEPVKLVGSKSSPSMARQKSISLDQFISMTRSKRSTQFKNLSLTPSVRNTNGLFPRSISQKEMSRDRRKFNVEDEYRDVDYSDNEEHYEERISCASFSSDDRDVTLGSTTRKHSKETTPFVGKDTKETDLNRYPKSFDTNSLLGKARERTKSTQKKNMNSSNPMNKSFSSNNAQIRLVLNSLRPTNKKNLETKNSSPKQITNTCRELQFRQLPYETSMIGYELELQDDDDFSVIDDELENDDDSFDEPSREPRIQWSLSILLRESEKYGEGNALKIPRRLSQKEKKELFSTRPDLNVKTRNMWKKTPVSQMCGIPYQFSKGRFVSGRNIRQTYCKWANLPFCSDVSDHDVRRPGTDRRKPVKASFVEKLTSCISPGPCIL